MKLVNKTTKKIDIQLQKEANGMSILHFTPLGFIDNLPDSITNDKKVKKCINNKKIIEVVKTKKSKDSDTNNTDNSEDTGKKKSKKQ